MSFFLEFKLFLWCQEVKELKNYPNIDNYTYLSFLSFYFFLVWLYSKDDIYAIFMWCIFFKF